MNDKPVTPGFLRRNDPLTVRVDCEYLTIETDEDIEYVFDLGPTETKLKITHRRRDDGD